MKKPDDFRTELLADVFADDWAHGPPGAFARAAAAQARQHRATRRALLAGSVAAGILVAAVVLSLPRNRPLPSSRLATITAAPAYETLSDAELIAQLKDRPLLIVPQQNGAPRIVVLD